MTEQNNTTENTTTEAANFGLSAEEMQMLKNKLAAEKQEKELAQKKSNLIQNDETFKMFYENSESFKSAIDQKPIYVNNPEALELLMKKSKEEMLQKEEPKKEEPKNSPNNPMYQTAIPNSSEQEKREGDKRTTSELSAGEIAKVLENTYGLNRNEAMTRALNFKVLRK